LFIHGITIRNFTWNEFPESPELADPKLLLALDYLRDDLGVPIIPSPVPGALARFDGSKTSQHYAVDRLSTGCDVFIRCSPFKAYSIILQSGCFTGVGIYFDTQYAGKPHVMFHLDIRDEPLMWYRDGNYHYNTEIFYENLLKLLDR